jgi:hypothetical protein
MFAEPPIVVSGAIRNKTRSLTNFQTATFTHANGVEAASDFAATINWGDGTTSAGTITQSGTTYTVRGSHNYSGNGNHTITTTVTEVGQAVDKIEDDDGKNWKEEGVVRLPGNSWDRLAPSSAAGSNSSTGNDASILTGSWSPLA